MGDLSKNVVEGGFSKNFSVQDDFQEAIVCVLEEFTGQMSLAQVLGVFELIKVGLVEGHLEE
jgi:hypothetical protein